MGGTRLIWEMKRVDEVLLHWVTNFQRKHLFHRFSLSSNEAIALGPTMNDLSEDTGHDYEYVSSILGEEMQRLDDEAEAILDSIRNETIGSPSDQHHDGDNNGGGDHNNNNYHSHHDTSDYDDDEIDDEINDEILKLGTVTANLRQDLDEISVESMTSHLSQQYNARYEPQQEQYYRYSRKGLALEYAANFLRQKNLYGPGVGGQERNTPLLVFAIAVWSILLMLVLHVRYGAMDEMGMMTMSSVFQLPQFILAYL